MMDDMDDTQTRPPLPLLCWGVRATWLRSPRRPHVGPPHEVGVLGRSMLLPRRYPTLSPVPVTLITIADKITGFLEFQERRLPHSIAFPRNSSGRRDAPRLRVAILALVGFQGRG